MSAESGVHLKLTEPVAAALLIAAFAVVYLPDVGHGFVKDDFVWIGRSHVSQVSDVATLFGAPTGFFRPLVSFSFAANRWICGFSARCYGITNFLLAVACAIGVFALARSLGVSRGAAILASGIWMFNWHGINMAVLWISGRTALLLVLCATLAATAFVKGYNWAAAALCGAAMLAKEEAVLIPLVLATWSVSVSVRRRAFVQSRFLAFVVPAALIEAIYFVLRAKSGAFTIGTAPAFYQIQFTASRLFTNLPTYFDRTATFALVLLVVYVIVCRPALTRRGVSSFDVVSFCAMWWVGTLALTVFLPVRSSLYACLPSVGTAILVASAIATSWSALPERSRRVVPLLGLAVPFVLWPVYHARNRPPVREAELSTATIAALRQVAAAASSGARVLVRDERQARPSLENSFGTLLQDAADLLVTPRIAVWLEPPPGDAALAGLVRPAHFDAEIALRGGQFTRLR